MFVQPSDFVFPYAIPNVSRMPNFNEFIEREERNVLMYVLGEKLYTDFINGLSAPVPDQKWLDLRDGKQYHDGSRLRIWGGVKKMLLAWIYSRYIRYNIGHFTGIGVNTANAENALTIPSVFIEANFYNEASEEVDEMLAFVVSQSYEYECLTRLGTMTSFSI